MYLEKVCVPDFRALKNVEICFERELKPSIFPLGSLNGGGKSTLLQLIFVLLHCSIHPDRIVFLKNLLNGFKTYQKSNRRILATIDIWENNKTIQLSFLVCKESFFQDLFNDGNFDKENYVTYVSASRRLEELNTQIFSLKREENRIGKIDSQLRTLNRSDNYKEKNNILRSINNQLEEEYISLNVASYGDKLIIFSSYIRTMKDWVNISNEDIRKLTNLTTEILDIIDSSLESTNEKIKEIELYKENFSNILKRNNMIYICEILPAIQELEEREILICQIKNIDINEATLFLEKISEKTFLAAHVSQVFLFLPPDSRKSLFKTQNKEELNDNDYYAQLRKEKPKLPGFFTYDFMAVDILIDSFKKARDLDFLKAIETGEYGENYKKLLEDLNHVLNNKKININKDLSGVTFKIDTDDTELYPEDLSHGELKRLCLYMWIKHHQIENSIVLMDEIEIAFHPDWQYQIVRDIEEWSPTNQYILATHSYELCQAVTPAHVKELEPKLRKNPK
ncbi:AAA family ATPase [Anabaena azotica]|uniref:AAA family ATPase n=1 Tax=Anabaena azotica FACHB-119 TaxID=947527 RepID=A0ABR8DA07_9NOST|nr:AAA family ATPase [Anabaena azotica]MBD2503761.1 AAA family ATPase [Anabaena azotica FACHB-119]